MTTEAANNAGAESAPGLGTAQYLTFLLSGEMYAVQILYVKEIIDYQPVTAIPKMPDFIHGVINLRGAVVPVINLAARFGKATSKHSKRTCIIVMELHEGDTRRDIGVVVDAVSEVIEIAARDIEPSPAFGARIRYDFIQGIGNVADKFLIILNVLKALSIAEMTSLTRRAKVPGDSQAELSTRKEVA